MISLLIWTAVLLAAADPPAKPELEAQVTRLVKQLDASQLTARDTAERELFELGPDILPFLPSIGDRTPAEVALRVTRLQQKLLRAQATASLEPSLVTLKGEQLPANDVFKELTKQTGNPISDYRQAFGEEEEARQVSADFDKTPFWKALDNVLDQANLTLYGYVGQRGAFTVNRASDVAPRSKTAVYSGVFRLEPLRFEALRDLRNESSSSLKFFIEVTWEPRLQPISLLQSLSDVSAKTDTGEAIAVTASEAEPEAMIREGVSVAELEIPLALPDREVKKISLLKGKFTAMVPGPVEDFRFSNLPIATKTTPAKRVEQRKAGTMVTIDQVRSTNDVWEVSLRVRFEAPGAAMESHRGWVMENEAYFAGPDGKRIEPGGIEQTLQGKDDVGFKYFFDMSQSPKDLTFVYRTPIIVMEVPVEYEFRDLPLP